MPQHLRKILHSYYNFQTHPTRVLLRKPTDMVQLLGKWQLTHKAQMLEFLMEMVVKLLQVMLVVTGAEVVLVMGEMVVVVVAEVEQAEME